MSDSKAPSPIGLTTEAPEAARRDPAGEAQGREIEGLLEALRRINRIATATPDRSNASRLINVGAISKTALRRFEEDRAALASVGRSWDGEDPQGLRAEHEDAVGGSADETPVASSVPLSITTTGRGFSVAEFVDRYGSECSIQDSSLATENCIWLGVDKPFNPAGQSCRMHLTQEMAAALLPLLQRFVETGTIHDHP